MLDFEQTPMLIDLTCSDATKKVIFALGMFFNDSRPSKLKILINAVTGEVESDPKTTCPVTRLIGSSVNRAHWRDRERRESFWPNR